MDIVWMHMKSYIKKQFIYKPKSLIINILIAIFTFCLCFSCKNSENGSNETEQDPLEFITNIDTLNLYCQNDKCGEWGGDMESIKLYREKFNSELLADYSKQIRNCKKPYDKQPYLIRKKRIKVSYDEKEIAVEAINELIKKQLASQNMPPCCGYSGAILSDSSIIVSISGGNWSLFRKLADGLLQDKK